MKVEVFILGFAMVVVAVKTQEMTIPVGLDGKDTLTTIRNIDAQGNYDMGYNENQLTGGASFYREKGYINGTRTGSYGYTTRNGLIRIVTYVADEAGYRAEVLTNEPGVIASNPASVIITKEQEPDPVALALGPTGVPLQQSPSPAASSSVTYVSDSDPVKDYVVASGGGSQGSAQVNVGSPFGQYQYVI
ncbi:adult-specific rigid cuticular protein 15.7-like [Argiope bruennichi]|nr:adult-specific rigid cuticular protein 15.7-like [Argiope bruennichi]